MSGTFSNQNHAIYCSNLISFGAEDNVSDTVFNRLKREKFDTIFNEIVNQCIQKRLVKSHRYIIDSTDVSVNAALPFGKKLVRDAFRKVVRELETFDEALAKGTLESFENDIAKEYEIGEKVEASKHYEIAIKHLEQLYLATHEELESNDSYRAAYRICYDIAEYRLNQKPDKIISVVDTEARAAFKSPRNPKVGYKDHIIIDEDSEIILASSQTPFNVGDEKKLAELLNKVEENFELKPKEVTADKVYGTIENRVHLKDNEIISNIAFYYDPGRQGTVFGIRDFRVREDVLSVTCPNNITTTKYAEHEDKKRNMTVRQFRFLRDDCDQCPLRKRCLLPDKKSGQIRIRSRSIKIPVRYDAIMRDMKRVNTEAFKEAYAKRFKVERRFGTMVWNHGLRRSRYIGLERTSIHIIMSNITSNVIRMVNLLCLSEKAVRLAT